MIVKRTLLKRSNIDVFVDIVVVIVIVIVILAIFFIDQLLLLTSTTIMVVVGRAIAEATTVEVER
jgi:hypothetical protein